MSIFDKFIALTRQLYPKGRAFRMPDGGPLLTLHEALAESESQAYADAVSVLDNILPDNDNFSEEDAAQWERRFGLITNESVSLQDRSAAIKRKINFPGQQKARGHYLFIQAQLQLAGFNVYVHENTGLVYPDTFNPSGLIYVQHGDIEHGDSDHGSTWGDIIANNLDPVKDQSFSIGENLRSTFYICGSVLGTYASIDADRVTEFRQLVLKLKPGQTVAFLLLHYT
jgi:hypothetical protein